MLQTPLAVFLGLQTDKSPSRTRKISTELPSKTEPIDECHMIESQEVCSGIFFLILLGLVLVLVLVVVFVFVLISDLMDSPLRLRA